MSGECHLDLIESQARKRRIASSPAVEAGDGNPLDSPVRNNQGARRRMSADTVASLSRTMTNGRM